MEKRFQVFVSSTYADLREERREVIQALLNAKYIPAGMELFLASNDEQFKYIKKIIDDCDYYVLIVGGRYGSINPSSGICFTEQEYDYAIKKNIPVLAFLYTNPDNLPPDKKDSNNYEMLNQFRAKVLSNNRLGKMWSTVPELVSSVLLSLNEYSSENPQLGWIRGGAFDNTALLEQVNQLRIESEQKNITIENLKKKIKEEEMISGLSFGNDKYTIKGTRSYGAGRNSTTVSHSIMLTWDEIFSAIGPYLYSTKSYAGFTNDLQRALNSIIPSSDHYFHPDDDAEQTIKIQLHTLKLIHVASTTLVNGGCAEGIILTEYGRKYLAQIKTQKKTNISEGN